MAETSDDNIPSVICTRKTVHRTFTADQWAFLSGIVRFESNSHHLSLNVKVTVWLIDRHSKHICVTAYPESLRIETQQKLQAGNIEASEQNCVEPQKVLLWNPTLRTCNSGQHDLSPPRHRRYLKSKHTKKKHINELRFNKEPFKLIGFHFYEMYREQSAHESAVIAMLVRDLPRMCYSRSCSAFS